MEWNVYVDGVGSAKKRRRETSWKTVSVVEARRWWLVLERRAQVQGHNLMGHTAIL